LANGINIASEDKDLLKKHRQFYLNRACEILHQAKEKAAQQKRGSPFLIPILYLYGNYLVGRE
jgi:hypothetical protein